MINSSRKKTWLILILDVSAIQSICIGNSFIVQLAVLPPCLISAFSAGALCCNVALFLQCPTLTLWLRTGLIWRYFSCRDNIRLSPSFWNHHLPDGLAFSPWPYRSYIFLWRWSFPQHSLLFHSSLNKAPFKLLLLSQTQQLIHHKTFALSRNNNPSDHKAYSQAKPGI